MLSSTLVLGVFASAAVAVNTARSLQFPDTVSLSERQSEGPRYECHANCGKKEPPYSALQEPIGFLLPAFVFNHSVTNDIAQAMRSRVLPATTARMRSGSASSRAASSVP